MVRICDQCIALCAEIVSDTSEPVYGKLRDWAQLELNGERFRWSAVRTTITTRDLQRHFKDRKEMVMIMVGRVGEEACGVLHPDGTEPTEQLAIEAIERMLE